MFWPGGWLLPWWWGDWRRRVAVLERQKGCVVLGGAFEGREREGNGGGGGGEEGECDEIGGGFWSSEMGMKDLVV